VVRDKNTGKPLAGASVFLNFFGVTRWGTAVTDKEGRSELLGLPKSPNFALTVKPAEGHLYFECAVALRDTPGLKPLTADFELVPRW
jgi:hypothetical protein